MAIYRWPWRKGGIRRNPPNSLLSRALISLREAGLAQHDEHCATKRSYGRATRTVWSTSGRGYALAPLRLGPAADVQRRRPPIGGESAEHLKMAACFISKRPVKVISMPPAENARTQGKRPFSRRYGAARPVNIANVPTLLK